MSRDEMSVIRCCAMRCRVMDCHGFNYFEYCESDSALLEIPAVAVSGGSEEAEPAHEGSSVECMGPPITAGTSSETTQLSEQSEDMLEGEDGVRKN